MTDTSRPRRRTAPFLAAAGVLAVVAVGVLLLRHNNQEPFTAEPLPPASPGPVTAGYLNSHWRLSTVTDGRGPTAIPATVDAWLELAPDGELLASDGVNTSNGRFTTTEDGFNVSDTATTLVGYAGDNPAQSAAIAAIDAMTSGPPAPSGPPVASPPVHVTVLSAAPETLTLQAGGIQLAFVRSGRAAKIGATPLPDISSAADR